MRPPSCAHISAHHLREICLILDVTRVTSKKQDLPAAGSDAFPSCASFGLTREGWLCDDETAILLNDEAIQPTEIPMKIVCVHVRVKPECVEGFKKATIENASASVKEPGIAQFDVIQEADDPTRFVLIEAYRSPDAPAKHKETAHYQRWRDAVADMMAEPRTGRNYVNVYPPDAEW
jgi:quinol monooxygenase YgiN